ncbi:MAG: DNA polymerase III subunit delta [Clostridia bacterium]|nr:DNA polymerase III subunit delta [Clostridia bacterium]
MDQWAFFDEIKAGTVRNVYLFHGPEAFIRRSAMAALEKKILMPGLESMNRTVLAAPTAQQIMESCETLPMMSDYRLIVVTDCALLGAGKAKDEAQESTMLCEYLPNVPPSTCLLFDAGGPVDKRKKLTQALMKMPGAVSFDVLDDAHLYKWMNQQLRPYARSMSREACETLAFTSGRDLTLLSGELAKLAAYTEGRAVITPQDVEAIATRTAESTVFVMVDALSAGKAEAAFSLLDVLLGAGEQRIGILAMITRHYRQMAYLCAMRDERAQGGQIAKALGVAPFVVNRLQQQARGRTFAQMERSLALCVQTDYDIKRGAVREDAALERLMLLLLKKDE